MKKTKMGLTVAVVLITIVTIIATLLLTSTVSIGGGSSEWSQLWSGWINQYVGTSSGKNYGFQVSDSTAAKYNNIYCIEKGGLLEAKKTVSWFSGTSNYYHVRAVVTLTGAAGGTGYVKYYDEGGFGYGSDEGVNAGSALTPGMHNRIMAAILNNYSDTDRGMWTGTGAGQNYTSSQKALYRYWDEWISAAGISSSFKCSSNYAAR